MTFIVSFLCGAGSLVLIWLLYPRDINYSQAVTDSYKFYDAERIGQLPANFRINWRGNAYLQVRTRPQFTHGFSLCNHAWDGRTAAGIECNIPPMLSKLHRRC